MINKFISKKTFDRNLRLAQRVISDSTSTRYVYNNYYYECSFCDCLDEYICIRRKCKFL